MMRYSIYGLFLLLVLCSFGADRALTPTPPQISVHFSPDGGCSDSIVRNVAAAESSVLVQAYVLTSKPIATALAEAKKRGCRVEVLLDRKGSKINSSKYTFLLEAGIPTLIDQSHTIAHNKIIVIDGKTVITGSFNFTDQAEKSNAENLLTIKDESIAAKYAANWEEHKRHSMEHIQADPLKEDPPAKATEEKTTKCQDGQCNSPAGSARRWRR